MPKRTAKKKAAPKPAPAPVKKKQRAEVGPAPDLGKLYPGLGRVVGVEEVEGEYRVQLSTGEVRNVQRLVKVHHESAVLLEIGGQVFIYEPKRKSFKKVKKR